MADPFKTPELLSPAGSYESLRAALAGGADAVYFGGSAFSNRMRAKNFTSDTVRDAIKLCHSVGAAAHITVNTRIRGRETDALLSFADILLGGRDEERADALIVADLGAARIIKSRFPDAVLHASTQTSMMSPSDCNALYSLGFSRLVVPRELTLDEIKSLVSLSPIEIEMFIHGAHCVSCSGQCLMSYVMGGRSGNRGECAQPCRLPFGMESDCHPVGGNYPLSLADMFLGDHITEIISSGVASLKIEGRMKNPAYVYGVTKIYRRLLDERRNATAAEKTALEDLFTRGFTDGYLTSRYKSMAGLKSSEKPVDASAVQSEISQSLGNRQTEYRESEKVREKASKTRLTAKFILKSGERAHLEFTYNDVTGSSDGALPQPSTGNPITAESAAKNLTKLGGSGFSLSPDDIDFTIDDGLWMPLSALNELRRAALADLEGKSGGTVKESSAENTAKTFPHTVNGYISEYRAEQKQKKHRVPEYTAEIADYTSFMRSGGDFESFAESFARVYIPTGDVKNLTVIPQNLCVTLPVFTPDDSAARKILIEAKELGIDRVMCHTVGQASLVCSLKMKPDVSFRANITNPYAAQVYGALGCSSLMLSPEVGLIPAEEIADSVSCDAGIIGYGRLPVMLLSRCIISGGACKKGNIGGRRPAENARPHSCRGELTDRMGETFPVIAGHDCTNTVYNSTPIWMGDRTKSLALSGTASFIHFMFSTESLEEAVSVLLAYKNGEARQGRRIRDT